ncbi:MAG: UbiA family prenyltransferase [Acetobacteraceae bacterium]
MTQVAGAVESTPDLPLVVDVDGTLVATDLLHEAALQFVAQYPAQIVRLPFWLRGGKAALKTELADRVDPGLNTVPLRPEVLRLIREAQRAGRPVYLASASDRRYVAALAERVGDITGVFGTETGRNLAGRAKAEQLVEAFGKQGFDYIGDMPVDFPVWRSARKPFAIAHSRRFAASVRAAFPEAEIVAEPRPVPKAYVRALRPHQWAKNALLFLPMLAGHRFDWATLLATILGFVCFSLAASSAYVVNDLLDLPGDRDHPRKRLRPFAAAHVPILHGVIVAAGAMVAAFALSFLLPLEFSGVLALYVAGTLTYSLVLKRKILIDVVTLSGLYTIRIYGGLAAVHERQTQWLLMFSVFLFLSLAVVKRCSELVIKRASGKTALMGRGYRVEDLSVLLSLGAAAGYGAVFVIALYLASPEVKALYLHPNRMWLLCPLLTYWISRVLLMCNRGDMHDDPLIFAMKDRVSWAAAAGAALIIAASI